MCLYPTPPRQHRRIQIVRLSGLFQSFRDDSVINENLRRTLQNLTCPTQVLQNNEETTTGSSSALHLILERAHPSRRSSSEVRFQFTIMDTTRPAICWPPASGSDLGGTFLPTFLSLTKVVSGPKIPSAQLYFIHVKRHPFALSCL